MGKKRCCSVQRPRLLFFFLLVRKANTGFLGRRAQAVVALCPACVSREGGPALSQGGKIYMPYPRGGKRKKESERESLFSYSSLFCHIAHSEQRRLALARISFFPFSSHLCASSSLLAMVGGGRLLRFPICEHCCYGAVCASFSSRLLPSSHITINFPSFIDTDPPSSPSPLLLLPSADPTPLRLQWQSSDERFMNHPSPTNQPQAKPYRLSPSPIPRFDCCRAEQQQMRRSLEAKKKYPDRWNLERYLHVARSQGILPLLLFCKPSPPPLLLL